MPFAPLVAATARLAARPPASTTAALGMQTSALPKVVRPFAIPQPQPAWTRQFSSSRPTQNSWSSSRKWSYYQKSSNSHTLKTPLAFAAVPVAVAAGTDVDSVPGLVIEPPPVRRRSRGPARLPLDPDIASEVSKGSFSGFALGILVSVFSRTLVFLLGLAITLQTLASKVGIDLAHHLKIKERVSSSKILSALNEHAAFKLSFGITFTMAAFMQF